MLDVKRAYNWIRTKPIGSALVQLHDGRVLEFDVIDKWLEGKRWRYNLRRSSPLHTLCGYSGDFVEEL